MSTVPGCAGCGDCCDPVYLAPGARLRLLRSARLGTDPGNVANGNAAWARDLRPRGDGYYDCPAFDHEACTCTRHDDLPAVCEDYPHYGRTVPRPSGLLPRCVYWRETPVALRAGVTA